MLTDVDEVSKIDAVERYTYIFDGTSEQLDHILVSDAIKRRGTAAEHIHVNNWSPSLTARASDHDPTVARFKVCAYS
jgi:predicted extracellular nuclease